MTPPPTPDDSARNEDLLRVEAARLRLLNEQIPAVIWTTDRSFRITTLTGAGLAILGIRPGQLEGQTIAEILGGPPANHPTLVAHARALAGESVSYDSTFGGRLLDSHVEPLRDAAGTILGVIGIAFDTTGYKRIEEQRALLASMVEHSDDAILSKSLEGTITSWNKGAERIFGYLPEEIIGKNVLVLIPPAYQDEEPRILERIKNGERIQHYETVRVRKDGTLIDVSLTVSPVRDGTGRIVAISKIARDVTERNRIRQSLRRQEAQLQCLSDANVMGLTLCDLHGTVHDANDAFLRMTGYSRRELEEGKLRWTELTAPDFHSLDARAVDQLRKHRVSRPYDKEYLRKDGSRLSVLVGASMVPGSEELCATFVLDMSDRRRLEEQLRHAQRMEVVGRLAGGVAHDFNNLLTPILGYCELLQEAMPPDAPYREDLDEIKKAGERAAGLTRQLLAFSRKQVLQPRVIELNDAITQIQKLLSRVIGEDVALNLHLAPGIGRIKVDPGQLEQILMNLAVNSRDAMPSGGTLTIETSRASLDEEYAHTHPEVVPGPHLVLAVSDTGVGMSKETMGHLFEPFFTTKKLGQGTGLGLATVYGIIKQSLGHVFVYSELGRGTTFKIYFPRVDEQASDLSLPVQAPKPDRGTETLLLVEDDKALRMFATRVLREKGYLVLEAGVGAEALMVAKGHPGPIHLLITDVVMPGMSGREVAEQLVAARPRTKVLFISGYTENAIVHHGVLDEDMTLLEKPFNQETLSRKVRQVLDGRGTGSPL